jgi:hypothetical protein
LNGKTEKLDRLKYEKSKNYNANKIQESIGDNRKTWEVIQENIYEITEYKLYIVTDQTDMAKSFNKYFSEMVESISSVPDKHQYRNSTTDYHPNTTRQLDNQILFFAATKAEIRSFIKNLKHTTSIGHDRLKVSTFKACIYRFTGHTHHIYC